MNMRKITVKKIGKILPEILIIFVCMVVLGMGVNRKEGYHMDELLSFQLSNAEYNPWIVPTQPEGRLAKFIHNEIDGENLGETLGNLTDTVMDVLQNKGASKLLSYKADVYEEPVWITAEEFQDYIAVDKADDFNYLSVYFNVKDDNHPPIHFMLLHTVASLFKGQVQPYIGCVINMAAVAVSMAMLMKIGRILAEILFAGRWGRWLGIFAAGLYGLSAGAMASVLLIRMYCVLTMFCVILLYLHLKKWREMSVDSADGDAKKGFVCGNKMLIVVTVLGFLTQYFFLFYCLVLAAITAALLLYYKKGKELLIYIRSMIIAAIFGLVCFPFAVLDVFASERGVEALGNLASGLSGYGVRLAAFWEILESRTFGAGLPVLVALAIAGIIVYCVKRKDGDIQRRLAVAGAFLMLTVPMAGYFVLAARMSPYLVDRYIMPLFPMVALLVAVGVMCLVQCIQLVNTRKWFVCLVCAVVAILPLFGLWGYDGSYLYVGYEKQLALAEKYAEYPCVCVYDGVGYYENLLEFANYKETLLVTEAELTERTDVDSVCEQEQLVVLVKEEANVENVCGIFQDKYGFVLEEELSEDGVYGDRLLLFRAID